MRGGDGDWVGRTYDMTRTGDGDRVGRADSVRAHRHFPLGNPRKIDGHSQNGGKWRS
jgi:hypothetical protein